MAYAGTEGNESTATSGYCTQSDLETRIGAVVLGQLTNDNATDPLNAEPDPTVVSALILKADTFIDNALSSVYDVPFGASSASATETPALVKQMSIDLACYYAMQRQPVTYKISDDWNNIYKDTLAQLERLQTKDDALNDATMISTSPSITNVTSTPQMNFYGRGETSQYEYF